MKASPNASVAEEVEHCCVGRFLDGDGPDVSPETRLASSAHLYSETERLNQVLLISKLSAIGPLRNTIAFSLRLEPVELGFTLALLQQWPLSIRPERAQLARNR